MVEMWKPVVGHESLYRVSNLGRVMSLGRHVIRPSGRYWKKGRVLNPWRRGVAWAVSLHTSSGVKTRRYVHHLVLEAFVGICPSGMEALHGPDRDTSNNRLSNLRWGTRAENETDKILHGNYNNRGKPAPNGEEHWAHVLSDADVTDIRRLYEKGGYSKKGLGRRFGVSGTTINLIVSGKAWKHLLHNTLSLT